MKESEAWREVARRIAEEGLLEWGGICSVAHRVTSENGVPFSGLLTMVNRAMAHVRLHDGGFFAYPPGTHAKERILAALWLALEAEEEGK